ncbi:uncharacterized protein LODBEIA_P42930 [Lodderomyces beijingensis]|uniref:Exocyst complex component Sec8 n=1 Tax=Lodderomyces beijingensis TaxID=1775926 RepID=A0ABP0ZQ74_9ASCO
MARRRISYVLPPQESQLKSADYAVSDLKMLLNELKYDWPQVLQADANPIETAISLLDDTSVGLAHRLKEFLAVKKRTEGVLRNVVDEHYELFSNSIGSYHMLLSTLGQSEEDSKNIKSFLETSSKDVADRNSVLKELSQSSVKYEEMIEILDAMQTLNDIPEEVEQLTADKKIHEIYDVIADAYKTAERYSLWSLPAMSGIKVYLEEQTNRLHDMIVDELQNEIYSKNDRSITTSGASVWQTLISSNSPQMASFVALIKSESLKQYVYNSANFDISEVVNFLTSPLEQFLFEQLPELHSHSTNKDSKINYKVLLGSTSNSSTESYYYIYKLLQTAAKLGRLKQVVASLLQNNSSELQGLINRTTEEVKSKNGYALSKMSKYSHLEKDSLFDSMLRSPFSDSAVVVLQELFGSIIVKCLITFQKHKVANEVVKLLSGGSSREAEPSKELLHVWNTTKAEIQNLILSYIYDEEKFNLGTQQLLEHSDNKIITSSFKPKMLFKFENVDWGSTKSAQELATSLSDIFPGFHIDEEDEKEALTLKTPYFEDEAFNDSLEVLVPKSLFNMRIILEPFLIFIDGSNRIFENFVEEDKKTEKGLAFEFFESFMNNFFMKYLKDGIQLAFGEQVGGSYAYSGSTPASEPSGLRLNLISLNQNSELKMLGDPTLSKAESSHVVFENAYNFKRLFLELCLILNTSLTYREEISSLALKTVASFATEYRKLFRDIVAANEAAHSSRPVSQVSKWMNNNNSSGGNNSTHLKDVSTSILFAEEDDEVEDLLPLIHTENEVLLFQNRNLVIREDDLLDNDSVSQIVHLMITVRWILSWLKLVKKVSNYSIYDDDQNQSVDISVVEKLRYNWSFLENGRPSITFTANTSDITQNSIFLALNQEKVLEFERHVSTFEDIRIQAMLALRYELRSRATFYVDLSFSLVDWSPATEPSDADHYIVTLNQEVFAMDNKLAKSLDESEKDRIFIGLSQFLNDLVIHKSSSVKKINANGIKRILLNISTLQQMLRSLAANPENINFNKSSQYFEMFTLNEFSLLNRAKANSHDFTREQYHNLARLIYSEKLADGNGSQFNKGKYSELVKKLDESLNRS